MKPLKNKVSITLDSDIIEQLKLLAEQDDRSFSQYINMILNLSRISFIFGMHRAYIFTLYNVEFK